MTIWVLWGKIIFLCTKLAVDFQFHLHHSTCSFRFNWWYRRISAMVSGIWSLFSVNFGHHQPTKIVINKKCPRFARIYGNSNFAYLGQKILVPIHPAYARLPVLWDSQFVFQEDSFLFFDTKCKMSTLKKTKNTHWMIKLVCKCSHSKSHSINHKQNYSVSLSDVSCVEIGFWQTSSPWQERNSTQAKRFFLQEHESVPQRFLLLQVQSKSCIT